MSVWKGALCRATCGTTAYHSVLRKKTYLAAIDVVYVSGLLLKVWTVLGIVGSYSTISPPSRFSLDGFLDHVI